MLGQLFAFPKVTTLATLFVAIGFFVFLLVSTNRHKVLRMLFQGSAYFSSAWK